MTAENNLQKRQTDSTVAGDSQPLLRGIGYEPTADDPQYISISKNFIGRNSEMFSKPGGVYLDFGGGTGTMAREIQALFPEVPATIIVMDPNGSSIEAGKRKTQNPGIRKVTFMHGYAKDLSSLIKDESLDGIVIGNAIHEIPEEERVDDFKILNRLLKPGGKIIANSTFMEESMEGLLAHWGRWKVNIKKLLQAERRADAPAAFIYMSVNHYIEQLSQAGFKTVGEPNVMPVDVGVALMEAIASYGAFVKGMCGDFSVPMKRINKIVGQIAEREGQSIMTLPFQEKATRAASEASIMAMREMAAEHRLKHPESPDFTIPRRWVELVEVKPSGTTT